MDREGLKSMLEKGYVALNGHLKTILVGAQNKKKEL